MHQHLLDDAPEQRPIDVVKPMFLQRAEKRRPLLLAVGIEQPVRAGRKQRGRRDGMLRSAAAGEPRTSRSAAVAFPKA